MSCKLPPEITDYLELVEHGAYRVCDEQKALARYVRRCFDSEDIFVDEKQLGNYMRLEKYFPFKLFHWEKFLTAVWDCTYWRESGLPRWSTVLALLGRGAGKDGFISLSNLSARLKDGVIGPAIYEGAAIVADAVHAEIKSLPTDEYWGSPERPKTGPTKVQKKGLHESLGIASMQDDGKGFLNVKIGFDGYNEVKTKNWPNGQPNQMVARAVESGTSFMEAHPFVKTAVQKSRKAAVAEMAKTVDEEIEKIMKG